MENIKEISYDSLQKTVTGDFLWRPNSESEGVDTLEGGPNTRKRKEQKEIPGEVIKRKGDPRRQKEKGGTQIMFWPKRHRWEVGGGMGDWKGGA